MINDNISQILNVNVRKELIIKKKKILHVFFLIIKK